jgi:hypothetical protein
MAPVNENIEWADEDDNGTGWATGGPMTPDTRTDEEKRRDTRRFARQRFVAVWKWRLRGLLPRGWRDDDRCC